MLTFIARRLLLAVPVLLGVVFVNLVEESHRRPSTLSPRVGTTQPHTTTRGERWLPHGEGLGPTHASDRVLEPVPELRATRSNDGNKDEKPTQCGAGERQEEDRHEDRSLSPPSWPCHIAADEQELEQVRGRPRAEHGSLHP